MISISDILAAKRITLIIFSVFAIVAFLNIFLYLYFSDKILPNTFIGDLPIGGKSQTGANEVLSSRIAAFEEVPWNFVVDNKTVAVTSHDLGIQFDREGTVERARSLGKSGVFSRDYKTFLKSFFTRTSVELEYSLQFQTLSETISHKLSIGEVPARSATITFQNGIPIITKATSGLVVDRSALTRDIQSSIEQLHHEDSIEVVSVGEKPLIVEENAKKAFERVRLLNNAQITLFFGLESWKLSGAALFDILQFYPYGWDGPNVVTFKFGNEPIVLESTNTNNSEQLVLDVGLDQQRIDAFIAKIADSIDQSALNATLRFEGGRVSEFTPAQDGQKLRQDETKALILQKLSIDTTSPEREIRITLPVAVTQAKIDNEEINSLGIKESVGKGISYFAGSIPNRAFNVGLGASRISGVLIKPGEVFSFNKTVGEISGATGYKQAYVISGGRTVLDDGGGICQVSTTLFRAVLDAGLPVVARTAHAYRVGYYEQRGIKPGLDATVWSPAVDFQFKNDTGHHILIQATTNTADASLQVDLFGTRDGRVVEMTQPVITKTTPALPDKHQDDPSLPRGTVKQVDFSAAGANVYFTRKVTKGGDVIINETFNSNYRPWQAIFLVGTGG